MASPLSGKTLHCSSFPIWCMNRLGKWHFLPQFGAASMRCSRPGLASSHLQRDHHHAGVKRTKKWLRHTRRRFQPTGQFRRKTGRCSRNRLRLQRVQRQLINSHSTLRKRGHHQPLQFPIGGHGRIKYLAKTIKPGIVQTEKQLAKRYAAGFVTRSLQHKVRSVFAQHLCSVADQITLQRSGTQINGSLTPEFFTWNWVKRMH